MSDNPPIWNPLGGPRQPRNRRRNPLWRIRRLLLLLAMFGVAGFAIGINELSNIPLPEDDFDSLNQTTFICSSDVAAGCDQNSAVARLISGEDRDFVNYNQIPDVMIQAVVATEDKDFFQHYGIDAVGIARALYQDIREQSASQGGSTITQQYVKNAYLTNERTLTRKIREATLAIKLERTLTGTEDDEFAGKKEILNRYLNRIYFGRGAYGVQAASQAYFGKDVEDIDLADAALLVSRIRAPNSGDPYEDPEEATRRRATVLTRMVIDGYIDQDQADEANERSWESVANPEDREGLGVVKGSEYGTEYFVEAVRQQLARLYPNDYYSAGLRVYTTLDHDLQRIAYETVTEELPPEDPDNPQASIVAVDGDGKVVAMMGGSDFGKSEVNLAMGRLGGGSGRQPGSSFKTFALAEALDQGISAQSLYSAPSNITLDNDGEPWKVRGGGSAKGYRDLLDSLRASSNVVFAQLMLDIGAPQVVDMATNLGVTAPLPPVNALVLGSGEVSVLDMASSYSTLAREGQALPPVIITRIENSNGEIICWYPELESTDCRADEDRKSSQVLPADKARQVNYALSQVVEAGTGRNAQFSRPAAGKTGTTQDARDAWFVGFTCDLTAAVWMGYAGAPGEPVRFMDNFRGIEVHGGDFPAQMWSRFMERATSRPDTPPCNGLPTQQEFPGTILNRQLSTTTLPDCLPPEAPRETLPGEITLPPSTEPCAPPTTVEGETDPNAPADGGAPPAPTTTNPDG